MGKEQFIERDARLKEFAARWRPGVEVEEELQQDFLNYSGQIAARRCFHLNVRGEKLEEIVANVQFAFLIAISSGKYVVTDAPVAGYISLVTRNEIFNDAEKFKAKSNWVDRYVKEFKVKVRSRNTRPVEEEVIETETLSELFDAIGDLTPEQQEPILLLAQGASHTEICQELQISDQSLRSRIYRAREVLREVLDNPQTLI